MNQQQQRLAQIIQKIDVLNGLKTIMRMRDLMETRGATEDGEDDADES